MPATNAATEASSHSIRQDCTTCQSRTVWGFEKTPASNAAMAHAMPMKKAMREGRDSPNIICKLLISKRLSQPEDNSSTRVAPQAWQKAAPGMNSASHSEQADDAVALGTRPAAGECQNSCCAFWITFGIVETQRIGHAIRQTTGPLK